MTTIKRYAELRRKTPITRSKRHLPKVNQRRKARRDKVYRAHLASKYWKILRCLIWQRDKGICQQCGQPAPTKGWHAAHRTNARFGHENLDDVEVNCKECNVAERQARAWYKGPITH